MMLIGISAHCAKVTLGIPGPIQALRRAHCQTQLYAFSSPYGHFKDARPKKGLKKVQIIEKKVREEFIQRTGGSKDSVTAL